MANTYTPTVNIVATTGASGVAGYTALAAAHKTAVNAALAAAVALTGIVPNSTSVVSGAIPVVDTDSHIQSMTTTIGYTILTTS